MLVNQVNCQYPFGKVTSASELNRVMTSSAVAFDPSGKPGKVSSVGRGMLSEGTEGKVGMEKMSELLLSNERSGNDIMANHAMLRRVDLGGEIGLRALPMVGKGDKSECSGFLYGIETL